MISAAVVVAVGGSIGGVDVTVAIGGELLLVMAAVELVTAVVICTG